MRDFLKKGKIRKITPQKCTAQVGLFKTIQEPKLVEASEIKKKWKDYTKQCICNLYNDRNICKERERTNSIKNCSMRRNKPAVK